MRREFGKGRCPDTSWGSTYNPPSVTLKGCTAQVRAESAFDSAARLAPGEKGMINRQRGKKLVLRTSKRSEGQGCSISSLHAWHLGTLSLGRCGPCAYLARAWARKAFSRSGFVHRIPKNKLAQSLRSPCASLHTLERCVRY